MEVVGINFKFVMLWRRFVALLLCVALSRYIFAVDVGADENPTVQEIIAAGFYGFEENIDVSAYMLTPTELLRIFSCVIKDAPYLFFISRNLRYSYKTNGCVLTLTPQYTMTKEEYEIAVAYCTGKVGAIAALAEHYESESEKALFLHDLICESFEYDDELKNDDIYDFLLTGKGTCEAYMLLYTAVLRECGIESHFAASDTLTHIWNIVRIDGEWYHVDLTWDDSASSDTVSRRHFLCSDKVALERGHRDWYSPIDCSCTSEKYENFDFDGFLQTDVKLGDVNHDAEVSLLDLLILRKWQTDKDSTDFCTFCADVDLDGAISEADIEILRKKLLEYD